jgi:hypothetical protein
MPKPTLEPTQALLQALGEGPWTFQTFPDRRKEEAGLTRVLHGDLPALWPHLEALNRRGAGAFFAVNLTDGKGRKAENVLAVRAVFLDLDGSPLEPVLEGFLPPTAIVESSPGRFHAYWRVLDLPLDRFRLVQERLARRFGGDGAVKDLARVMRLPGTLNWKREEPFPVRLLEVRPERAYRVEDLEGAWPGLTAPPPPLEPKRASWSAWKGGGEVPRGRLEGLLRWACEEVARTPGGSRHIRLLALARLMGGYVHLGLDPEAVVEVLARAGVEAGLSWGEALSTARDGVEHGQKEPLALEEPTPRPKTYRARVYARLRRWT